ncbi:hypothetical protein CYMTET_29171 [Cymbomonas tetramitiformis]|uniref:Kinesin light chain n=1 Tax=Cymbomonas tetramitiformis TaxID=36881 RepID=A0AAE0FLC7_9CHLO|nr:hypothetical protein CYMTET_29171 [Cymbomonas tetramitiformis]
MTHEYSRAIELRQNSIKKKEEVLGSSAYELATSLNNLAEVLSIAGRPRDAVPLYLRAQKIFETTQGEDHPDVAIVLNNRAVLCREEGKFEEALALRRKCWEIERKHLGKEHPQVASSLLNMAVLLEKQGKHAEAARFIVEALRNREAAFGSDHPSVAQTVQSLAVSLRHQGEYAAAEPHFERVLRMWKNLLGPKHPQEQVDTKVAVEALDKDAGKKRPRGLKGPQGHGCRNHRGSAGEGENAKAVAGEGGVGDDSTSEDGSYYPDTAERADLEIGDHVCMFSVPNEEAEKEMPTAMVKSLGKGKRWVKHVPLLLGMVRRLEDGLPALCGMLDDGLTLNLEKDTRVPLGIKVEQEMV